MTSDELIRRYGWVKKIEAWTVAVVRGRDPDDVLRVYGADPGAPVGRLTFHEVNERRSPRDDHLEFYVQLLTTGESVVAIENNGYSGAFPEVARRCSTGGRFHSVYWSIAAAGMVTEAVDGVITGKFEPLYPFAPAAEPWERRPAWAIGPEVDVELAWQACMAQLEQQTGVVVEESWLAEPCATYRVPGPYGHYRDVAGADRI